MLSTDQLLNQGRYRIVGNFSHSPGGGVYEAYDTVSETKVVLKETLGNSAPGTSLSHRDELNAALLGRAKTLREIQHGSLVEVRDYFADIDRQYLVFEPVTGLDLAKFLDPAEPRPPLSDALSWTDQLLDALNVLHTQATPLIHGDVNPRNIKLNADSSVKLMTGWHHSSRPSDTTNIASVRSAGDLDMNFRPLEQLWDGLDNLSQRVILNQYDQESEEILLQPLSPASDLYSLGATIYAVLTGVTPADALERSIAAIDGQADPLQDPTVHDASIPPEIAEVIMKAMALRREDRFSSAVMLRQIFRTAAVRVKERQEGVVPVVPAVIVNESSVPPAPPVLVEAVYVVDDEKARLAEEQKQQEAEQARLLAARILEEKSEHPTATPAPTRETQHSTEIPEAEDILEIPQAVSTAERLAFREDVHRSIDPKPVSSAVTTESEWEVKADESHSEPVRRGWLMPVMAAAAVVVIAGVIGVYKFVLSAAPAAAPTSTAMQLNAPVQAEAPTPEPQTAAIPEPVPAPATSEVQSGSVTGSEPGVTQDKLARSVQTGPAADKTKKPVAPAPAKTQAPKKAMTVDDLINDH